MAACCWSDVCRRCRTKKVRRTGNVTGGPLVTSKRKTHEKDSHHCGCLDCHRDARLCAILRPRCGYGEHSPVRRQSGWCRPPLMSLNLLHRLSAGGLLSTAFATTCGACLSPLGPRPTCQTYLGQLDRRLRQRHVLQCVHAHHLPNIVSRPRAVVNVRF
jgi:hypothetical protein